MVRRVVALYHSATLDVFHGALSALRVGITIEIAKAQGVSSLGPGGFFTSILHRILGIGVGVRQLRAQQSGGADKPQELPKIMREQN